MIRIIPILFVLFILSSCEKNNCFRNFGNPTTIEFPVDSFTQLDINDVFHVYTVHDSVNKVEIIAGENIIDQVQAMVTDNVLSLSFCQQCRFMNPSSTIDIYVHYISLNTIHIYEPSYLNTLDSLTGDVTVTVPGSMAETDLKFNCSSLVFYTSWESNGVYHLSGKAGTAHLYAYKGSVIHADSLFVDNNNVYNYSIGNIYVTAIKSINAWMNNYGNIYYHGEPEPVINEQTSKGRLIRY
jgi:hypothetical protein